LIAMRDAGGHFADADEPAHWFRGQAGEAEELRVTPGVGTVRQPDVPTLQLQACQRAGRHAARPANVLKQLDEELDRLIDGWRQTLLDNLEDPIDPGKP
jgi:hypothetical protein